jgi:ABC-type antimicrobial peptide transport system permease subunit
MMELRRRLICSTVTFLGAVLGAAIGQALSLALQTGFLLAHLSEQQFQVQLFVYVWMAVIFFVIGLIGAFMGMRAISMKDKG